MRKNLLILALLTLTLFGAGLVAGQTVTIDSPAADAVISGSTVDVGATLSGWVNVTNATAYYRIDSGSWVTIGSINTTLYNATTVNFTWDTTALQDDQNLDLNITATNFSSTQTSDDTNTGVDIDNGLATCTYTSTTVEDLGFVPSVFTVGTDADTTIGVDSCTISLNTVTAGAGTVSGDACTFADQTYADYELRNHNQYAWSITLTDGNSNNTVCTERTMKVQVGGSGSTGGGTDDGVGDIITKLPDKDKNPIFFYGGISIAVIIILWVLMSLFKSGGKKRR